MLLFFDEGLPRTVAPALRAIGMDARCSGEDGCPLRDARESDSAVVEWCVQRKALLLTADLSAKSPEMVLALERELQPVVFVRPQPAGRALLHAVLDQHNEMLLLHRAAVEAGKQTIIDLDLSAMRPKARRRKALPNLASARRKSG